jgi:hypothetical protein
LVSYIQNLLPDRKRTEDSTSKDNVKTSPPLVIMHIRRDSAIMWRQMIFASPCKSGVSAGKSNKTWKSEVYKNLFRRDESS